LGPQSESRPAVTEYRGTLISRELFRIYQSFQKDKFSP
jgi:hypothetical protein